jgi:hypothetical protein
MLATIIALYDLYYGKSFDIMARETCIVIVSAYAFGILAKYALIALIKDVIKKNIEDAKVQKQLSKKMQAEAKIGAAGKPLS